MIDNEEPHVMEIMSCLDSSVPHVESLSIICISIHLTILELADRNPAG